MIDQRGMRTTRQHSTKTPPPPPLSTLGRICTHVPCTPNSGYTPRGNEFTPHPVHVERERERPLCRVPRTYQRRERGRGEVCSPSGNTLQPDYHVDTTTTAAVTVALAPTGSYVLLQGCHAQADNHLRRNMYLRRPLRVDAHMDSSKVKTDLKLT